MLTIGDIAKVFDGPHATPKKIESGPYFLSISSLENGKLDLSKSAHLSDEDFAKWTRRVTPEAGDILFSYETRLGEVAMMPAGVTACLGRRMGLLRPDRTKILPEYLLYAYQSNAFQEIIRAKTIHGATVDRIALKELPSFPIQVPPLPEQQKIVDILKGYDRKLVLNLETNQTLEQMAQAIFKSWFVDFEPVKAKMNGEQPEGMDAATASLFPEKLVESELGLIPEGWDVLPSEKVATVAIGKTPPRKEPQWFSEDSKDVTWISIRDMGNTGTFALDSSEYLTQEAVDKFNVKVIPDNTLILSFKLTVGRIAITHGEMTTNEAIAHYKLSDNARVSTNYLYSYMKQFNFDSLGSTSSIAKAVNSKIIKALPVVVPSKEVLDSFDTLVKPLFDKIKSNQMENQSLEDLRNTLLPKLLSGEIELGQTEEMV